MVYVSEIVLYRDCLKLAYLKALTTSDTSIGAGFTCHATLVLINAADVETAPLGTLLAELDDMTWTSVGASTTTRTLLFINLRNASFRIDRDCAKLAGSHAIATTQTAEPAACFASAT